MESVMNKIRQAREGETKRYADKNITETVVDGCTVKLRFGRRRVKVKKHPSGSKRRRRK